MALYASQARRCVQLHGNRRTSLAHGGRQHTSMYGLFIASPRCLFQQACVYIGHHDGARPGWLEYERAAIDVASGAGEPFF